MRLYNILTEAMRLHTYIHIYIHAYIHTYIHTYIQFIQMNVFLYVGYSYYDLYSVINAVTLN